MKVLIASDIHSNKYSLEKLIKKTQDEVDYKICLGDVVGYNSHPSKCVDLARDFFDTVLLGNHDRRILEKDLSSKNENVEKGLRISYEKLSEEQKQWLETLNQVEYDPVTNFILCHSHPEDIDERVYPSDAGVFLDYIPSNVKGLFYGHTHKPVFLENNENVILNPGSIGQPRQDNSNKSTYYIYDAAKDTFNLKDLEYDKNKMIRDNKKENIPKATNRLLKEQGCFWED